MIAIESGNINFIQTGHKGQTVVMLHPIGMDLTLWGDQIDALKDKYDVIALDIPGHGLSGKLDGEHSFDNIAAVIGNFIAGLITPPIHLVGISFGGMIAQEIAIKRPDLIRSLALIGTACTFDDPVRQVLKERADFVRTNGIIALAPLSLARWFTPEFSVSRPDVIDRITKLLYLQDAFYHGSMWDVVSSLDTRSRLMELFVPAMVIVGDKDTSTPLAAAQVLAVALKTDKLHIIDDSAHFTILEAPEAVNNLLLAFFESL
jgi:3-oxoadipate enol-lactonase